MTAAPPPEGLRREQWMLLTVAAVQFVNIVDFIMVMPLGPDLAVGLGIDPAHLGILGGAYTGAAAITGLVGSAAMDRFDRRRALVLALVGLAVGTGAAAASRDLSHLIAARLLAGAFGGPATALALAIVADQVPFERRGRALGLVMGAFSLASVLGVPASLELARWGGWRAPFLTVCSAGLAVALLAWLILPPLDDHLRHGPSPPALELFRRPVVGGALLLVGLQSLSRFCIIPSLAPYLLGNLGVARDKLGWLYLVGGVASLVAMRTSGRLVDRLGSSAIFLVSTVVQGLTLWTGLGLYPPLLAPVLLFPLFMASSAFGAIALQTLLSQVPGANERARFQSAQSAAQHIGSALGASLGAAILASEGARLLHMPRLVVLSLALSLLLPPGIALIDRRLRLQG